MRIPLSWLATLVDLPDDLELVRKTCELAGLEIAQIERLGAQWQHIVLGKVLASRSVEGTHLHHLEVDCGEHGTKSVVSGAPNADSNLIGAAVAVALPGAKIFSQRPDGGSSEIVVEPRTLRGLPAEAVLLSERELGLSDDHSGVLVLTAELAAGTPLEAVRGETILHFELTPDLGRCFSAFGLARELGALLGKNIHPERLALASVEEPSDAQFSVTIEEPDLCNRYLAAVISGVEVGPSPEWMQRRLVSCGMRPLNNLVDIANYVMLEVGQPLHFFDADRLAQATDSRGAIAVRRAREGESLEALNGQTLALPTSALVIADTAGPVAVAGVIGGLHSAVQNGTTRVLLEAAHFDHRSIRKTAQILRTRTDAAERFIKDVDPENTKLAMQRAIQLVSELCPGARLEGYRDLWPVVSKTQTLSLTEADVTRLLGLHVPLSRMAELLLAFGFAVETRDHALVVTAPSFRKDVTCAADLIEEIARGFGMNNIPIRDVGVALYEQPAPDEPLVRLQTALAEMLCGMGFYEAIHYSLVPRVWNAFDAPLGLPREGFIELANPLSSDRDTLRTTLAAGLANNIGEIRKSRAGGSLFELGRIYLERGAQREEHEILALVTAGARRPPYWGDNEGAPAFGAPMTLFDLKGVVQAILRRVGAQAVEFTSVDSTALTPGQAIQIWLEGEAIGYLGQVDDPWAERFDTGPLAVFVAELRLEPLLRCFLQTPRFSRIPVFPPVLRDLSLLVPSSVQASSLLRVIRAAGGEWLTQAELFDRYLGPGVPTGSQSLAVHLEFQNPHRTLQSAEVEEWMAGIVAALDTELGAKLRG